MQDINTDIQLHPFTYQKEIIITVSPSTIIFVGCCTATEENAITQYKIPFSQPNTLLRKILPFSPAKESNPPCDSFCKPPQNPS